MIPASAYLRQLRLAEEVGETYRRRLEAAGFVLQDGEVHVSGYAESRLVEALWRRTCDEFQLGK
jgi:hypothetical protein